VTPVVATDLKLPLEKIPRGWECIVAWDILILKILAVRSDGEATTAEISRDLAIVDRGARIAANDHSIDGGLFGAKLVTSPRRGVWRITERGRRYLDNHVAATGIPLQLAAE
jgi:hypothetical protein